MKRDRHGAFWDLAAPYLASGACDEGTIMGGPCLRTKGEFVAMFWQRGGGLVVKLDEQRVRAHLSDGVAMPFAPAGRVFREWLVVPETAVDLWPEVLDEAVALALARAK
ncbi:MAG: hypothetical protein ABI577_10785 [bacterium]